MDSVIFNILKVLSIINNIIFTFYVYLKNFIISQKLKLSIYEIVSL